MVSHFNIYTDSSLGLKSEPILKFKFLANMLFLSKTAVSEFLWRFCVVTLLFEFYCRCRVVCHRTESTLFLLL